RPSSRPPVPRAFRGGLVGDQPVAAGPEPGGAVPPARRIAALPLAADQVGAGGDAGPAVLGVEQVGGPGGAHRAQGEVLRVVDEAGPQAAAVGDEGVRVAAGGAAQQLQACGGDLLPGGAVHGRGETGDQAGGDDDQVALGLQPVDDRNRHLLFQVV